MSRTECVTNSISMCELRDSCRFAEKFMAFCRECRNYGANWACPPFDFDVPEYLDRYDRCCVFGVKMNHDEAVLARIKTSEQAAAYSAEIFKTVKDKLLALLFHLEEKFPGSVGASAGGCSFCGPCARSEGTPCPTPGRVRYSLESLGFDVVTISEKLLGVKILWGRDSLPPYQTLVNALFFREGKNASPEAVKNETASTLASIFPEGELETAPRKIAMPSLKYGIPQSGKERKRP